MESASNTSARQAMVGRPGHRLLGDVAAAIEAAHGVALSCLSRREVGAWVCEVQSLRARLDSLAARAAVAADDALIGVDGGLSRTTDQFVAARTAALAFDVRADGRLGRWLEQFPAFAAALAAGEVSRAQVEVVRKADNWRVHHGLVEADEFLAGVARDCGYDKFVVAFEYWQNHNDPDGDRPRDQLAKTGVRLRPNSDGSLKGNFYLDPIAAQAFCTAVEAEEQKLYLADTDTDTDTDAGADAGTRAKRSVSMRRAHALLGLVIRGAARDDGTFPMPLINVVMSQKVAEDTLARALSPSSEPIPVHHTDIDGRCELIDGTPIHPLHVLAVMGVANFRRHIIDAKSKNLDVSSNARTFPAWMRNAILVAARGRCKTDGCDAPYAWLQIDHIIPHSRGGPTRIDNANPLCGPDNRHKSDRIIGEPREPVATDNPRPTLPSRSSRRGSVRHVHQDS